MPPPWHVIYHRRKKIFPHIFDPFLNEEEWWWMKRVIIALDNKRTWQSIFHDNVIKLTKWNKNIFTFRPIAFLGHLMNCIGKIFKPQISHALIQNRWFTMIVNPKKCFQWSIKAWKISGFLPLHLFKPEISHLCIIDSKKKCPCQKKWGGNGYIHSCAIDFKNNCTFFQKKIN